MYIIPFAVLLIAGCVKSTDNTPTFLIPSGTFTGQFLRVSRVGISDTLDTIKANIQLTLNTTTGFKLTGDTTLHAASFGGYALNQYYIQFNDQSQPSAKYHLNGVYDYSYNGTQFNVYNDFGDTLSYQYILKKSN